MNTTCGIAVIGGGAAGLAACIFSDRCSDPPIPKVVLLDGAKQIGAKILVSGGARCNVTHHRVAWTDYNGTKTIVQRVLSAFDEQRTAQWFESLGVRLKTEATGKLFPVTNRAKTVLEALLNRCRQQDVAICPQHRVHQIRVKEDGLEPCFEIDHEQGTLTARRLIMATGGRSLPRTGSDGHGWQLVEQLGHTVTPTYPALVPLVLDPFMFHGELSGLSVQVTLSTFANGKQIDRRCGSLLWTHFGISGPVVMDASRFWIVAKAQGKNPVLRCHFLPNQSFEQVDRQLIDQTNGHPKRSVLGALSPMLPTRLAKAILTHGRIDPALPSDQLKRQQRRQLVHLLTSLELPVTGSRGWNHAEVTAGGVPLNEIDARTMASRKVPGLYLIGEMLDCDGRIGGFNFQWAWSTGHIAGQAAAKSLI